MDLGLRNAKLNFRQLEKSHLMENMIYLELVRRGYSVDVGVVEVTRVKDGKKRHCVHWCHSIPAGRIESWLLNGESVFAAAAAVCMRRGWRAAPKPPDGVRQKRKNKEKCTKREKKHISFCF